MSEATPDANGWMPIGTAPRDGPVFFWSKEEGRHYGWYSKSLWLAHDERDENGGAWVIDDPRDYPITFRPTHWHPLPEPPVQP
jgi:hypothetical protein